MKLCSHLKETNQDPDSLISSVGLIQHVRTFTESEEGSGSSGGSNGH